jgi:signal transduction histidine kinase
LPRISLKRPAGSVPVLGDPARIAQILDNLLSNAVKYSGPADPIEVLLTSERNEAQVRVSDHGIGVPEDERDLLFTPFYRTTRTVKMSGSGLGLHISKRLTERHGGRMWLEATSSAGSVFAFALPLASVDAARGDS